MSYRTSRLSRGVPRNVLNAAKDPNDLRSQLYLGQVTSSDNYTTEILDVFLLHLRKELLDPPPRTDVVQWERQLEPRAKSACACGVMAITQVLQSPDSPSTMRYRDATIEKLLAALDGILAWFEYIILHPGTSTPWLMPAPFAAVAGHMCYALYQMRDADPRLAQGILTDKRTATIVISCYNLRNDDGTPCASFATFLDSCAIVQMFHGYASLPENKPLLNDLLGDYTPSSTALRKAVVESTVARLEIVDKVERRDVIDGISQMSDCKFRSPVQPAVVFTDDIVSVVEDLCSISPVLLEDILRSRFPYLLVKALEGWLGRKFDAASGLPPYRARMNGFKLIFHGLSSILTKPGSTKHALCTRALVKMIDGGLLSILKEGYRSLSGGSSEESGNLISLTAGFNQMTTHPLVAMKLGKTLDEMEDFRQSQNSDWVALCMGAMSHASHARRLAEVGWRVNLCDNFKCKGRGRDAPASSKWCSGCKAVLYCSPECQKEDWDAQHKVECPQARIDFRDAKLDGFDFPPRLRQFYHNVTMGRANGVCARWEQELPQSISEKPIILIFGVRGQREVTFNNYPFFRADMRPRTLGELHRVPGSTPLDRHYFDGRAEKFVKEFALEGGAKLGFRIVEALYQYGDVSILHMVKLKRLVDGESSRTIYVPVSTVTRIGIPKGPKYFLP